MTCPCFLLDAQPLSRHTLGNGYPARTSRWSRLHAEPWRSFNGAVVPCVWGGRPVLAGEVCCGFRRADVPLAGQPPHGSRQQHCLHHALVAAVREYAGARSLSRLLLALEILHCALMRLRGFSSGECPKVAALASLCILLTRIEPVFSRLQLANHEHLAMIQRFRYNYLRAVDAKFRHLSGLKVL